MKSLLIQILAGIIVTIFAAFWADIHYSLGFRCQFFPTLKRCEKNIVKDATPKPSTPIKSKPRYPEAETVAKEKIFRGEGQDIKDINPGN